MRRAFPFAILSALIGCSANTPGTIQGYAEGEFVRVASPIAGRLSTLAVQRGVTVKAGTPLFALERESEQAAVREAEERLRRAEALLENLKKGRRPTEMEALESQRAQADAALALAAANFARAEKLFSGGLVSREQLDEARMARDREKDRVAELAALVETGRLGGREDEIRAARAEAHAARAAADQARWRLGQKSVESPAGGVVTETFYTPGEWVPSGSPVVEILPPGNIKVRFFVPEPGMGSLRIGQPVEFHCDGCGATVPGHISFISPRPEYTPPVLYSKENRHKLVFLIEAAPSPDGAARLHPGQPVDVTLK